LFPRDERSRANIQDRKNERKNERINARTNARTHEGTNEGTNGWTDGRMDGRMDALENFRCFDFSQQKGNKTENGLLYNQYFQSSDKAGKATFLNF